MILDYVTLEEGFTICIHMTTTYPFLQVESSPGPISPSENERHNLSSGSGNSSANAGAPSSGASAHHHANQANQANNMPLSDNNVSTTNNMAMANTWDMTSAATHSPEQDINVSLALPRKKQCTFILHVMFL